MPMDKDEDDDGEDYEAEIFGALKMYTTYEYLWTVWWDVYNWCCSKF